LKSNPEITPPSISYHSSDTTFTDLGVENLAQLVEIYKADPGLMARYPKPD
jgi:hypothetical protein